MNSTSTSRSRTRPKSATPQTWIRGLLALTLTGSGGLARGAVLDHSINVDANTLQTSANYRASGVDASYQRPVGHGFASGPGDGTENATGAGPAATTATQTDDLTAEHGPEANADGSFNESGAAGSRNESSAGGAGNDEGAPEPPAKYIFGVDANWLNGQANDLDFAYEKLTFKGEMNLDTLKLLASAGVVNRSMSGTDSGQAETGVGRIGVHKTTEVYMAAIDAGQNVFADLLQSDVATQALIRGQFVDGNFAVNPVKNWRATLNHHSAFFSDSNRRLDDDLAVMYGLSPEWPWIWIGAGYERLSDSSPSGSSPTSPQYWSPREFSSYGPRLDLAFPVYGLLTAAMAFNFNWFTDIDYGSGTGYYGTAKLLYGSYEGRQVSLGLESISSKQLNSRWTSTAVLAGLVWPL